ncbi:hypothetical protein FHS27_001022 [Rhodopirellula rubra]|uniref:Uncharacterized protein n=1 Tax=Aporhodopirellula rubra TaxID=980271 RepID=A0A7W5H3F2_9BACT|nr:hypothetical protein [Aporhodopirellula rubra]MBB3205222.1 hypothetical protein [Aporhodopirellula rubra]
MAKTVTATVPTPISDRPSHLARRFGTAALPACSVLLAALVALAPHVTRNNACAQSTTDATLQLSEDAASDSQLQTLRSDLFAAITEGASPHAITGLVNRQRRIDDLLDRQLLSIRDELAEIERSEFDPKNTPRREELKRRQSLLWLSRVELASLATEMFAERSPDGVAMAEQSIRLMRAAIASFPNNGVVRAEILRLLSEAQLRAGDADAAIRTMLHVAHAKSESTDEPNDSAETPKEELVINTPDELAFVIRVDLSKQDWRAAEEKLNQFYADAPAKAPLSLAMDMARLQFLLLNPKRADSLTEIGQWIDAIEQRGGAPARRGAETLLARYREFRQSLSPHQDIPASSIDPRVLRADARYYLRVEKTLPAAVTFAHAAVQDGDADRSIDSAIRSAAILTSTDKRPAAVQLLRQIANRHESHENSPLLMLQAASLASEVEAAQGPASSTSSNATSIPSADEILHELLAKWPLSPAAASARASLIEIAKQRNEWIDAAILATELPVEHWNETASSRCRDLWMHAILPSGNACFPCGWDDDACRQRLRDELASRLAQMRNTFVESAAHPAAIQAQFACAILLDSAEMDSPGRPLLVEAAKRTEDPFLRFVAELRLGSENQVTPPHGLPLLGDEMRRAVVWRLHHDLTTHAVPRRTVASFLLAFDHGNAVADPRCSIAWLMWSERTEQGFAELGKSLDHSKHPGELIAAAASALSDSSRSRGLKRAAGLWDELASGIPPTEHAHQRAKVESILCRARSGDLTGAKAAAEWMLLSNPPTDESLIEQLKNAIQ